MADRSQNPRWTPRYAIKRYGYLWLWVVTRNDKWLARRPTWRKRISHAR
jgi:hypothetical protein